MLNALGPTMGDRMCLVLETMMDYWPERADATLRARTEGKPANEGYELMLQDFMDQDFPSISASLRGIPTEKWRAKMSRVMTSLLAQMKTVDTEDSWATP